jgi:hypothetical protein
MKEKTITQYVAKRIRRGQPWQHSVVPDETIVRWARQYAIVRSKSWNQK